MAIAKRPRIINKDVLTKKNTKELLGYLKKLQKCEDSFEKSDMVDNPDITDSETIFFKQTDKWKTSYNNVKFILKDREHIKK